MLRCQTSGVAGLKSSTSCLGDGTPPCRGSSAYGNAALRRGANRSRGLPAAEALDARPVLSQPIAGAVGTLSDPEKIAIIRDWTVANKANTKHRAFLFPR